MSRSCASGLVLCPSSVLVNAPTHRQVRRSMRRVWPSLIVVLLHAQATQATLSSSTLRLLSPRVSPRVLRATRLTMAEPSPSERLASLQKTLDGLREGGYAKEMLEPLQREIELLAAEAAAAPPAAPPTAAPTAAPPAAAPPAAPTSPATPVFVRPFDPNTGAGVGLEPPPPPPTSSTQPTPAFVRPFNPDSDGDEEAVPPPPPPRKRVNGINSLRQQAEANYVPAEGLNPAAELLRRRQEARRERGEPSGGGGGGGGGGWFAGLGLSPEARAARDQARAAEVSCAPRHAAPRSLVRAHARLLPMPTRACCPPSAARAHGGGGGGIQGGDPRSVRRAACAESFGARRAAGSESSGRARQWHGEVPRRRRPRPRRGLQPRPRCCVGVGVAWGVSMGVGCRAAARAHTPVADTHATRATAPHTRAAVEARRLSASGRRRRRRSCARASSRGAGVR